MKKSSSNNTSQRIEQEQPAEDLLQYQAVSKSDSDNSFQLTPLQELIDRANGQGRYQFTSFLIFCSLWFFASWPMVGQSFFFEANFTCKNIQDEETCEKFICGLEPSTRKQFLSDYANSITFAFDDLWMICEYDYLPAIFISIFYFGSLIGFFIIPSIADNFGRRLAMVISWGIYGFGILLIAISMHPAMIGAGEFIAGFGCNPAITLCYSFLNEQCLRDSRQKYGVGIQVFIALGECVIGFLFLPAITWRYVFFLLFGLIVATFFSLFYLLQSPKFLLNKSKEKTLIILNKMAKINKREPIEMKDLEEIYEKQGEDQEKGASILDLFCYMSLRTKTIASGIIFFGIQAIYYSTLLNLESVGFTKLVNQEIIGISQALSVISTSFFISKVKRKKSSIIGMGMASLFCFILAALSLLEGTGANDAVKLASTIGLMIGRFFIMSFWAIFYVYLAEMYPTRVRSLGFGWASAMGTVGSTSSPYIILFSENIGLNTWVIPGITGIISVISLFFLKETFGKPLQDEIQQNISSDILFDKTQENDEKNI